MVLLWVELWDFLEGGGTGALTRGVMIEESGKKSNVNVDRLGEKNERERERSEI